MLSDMNKEPNNKNEWFVDSKLSLNVKKIKYFFSHKPRKKNNIPFRLPNLTMNISKIKQQESIKFMAVLLNKK